MPEMIISTDRIVGDGVSDNVLGDEAHRKAILFYSIIVIEAIIFYFTRTMPFLALASAFIVGFTVGKKDFQIALLCYIALSPIIHPIFSVEISGLPLLTFSRIIFAGILAAWPFACPNQNSKALIGKRLFILFLVSIFITALISDDIKENLNSFSVYFVEYFLLLYLLYRYLSEKHLDVFVRLIFISYFICLLFGIIEVIRGQSLFLGIIGSSTKVNAFEYPAEINRIGGIARIYSLFEHPFAFGNFCAMTSLLGLGYYSIEKSKKHLIIFLSAIFPIVFSFSRATLVFWFVIILIYMIIINARVRKYFLLSFPFIILILFFVIPLTPLGEYFQNYFNINTIMYGGVEGSSIENRMSDIGQSLEYFKQNFFFGFGNRTINNLVLSRAISSIGFLESNFIRLLLAFGIVGFILFISYLLLILLDSIKRIMRNKIDLKERMLYVMSISLIIGFIENSLHSSWINEQLFLLLINLPFIFNINSLDNVLHSNESSQ